MASKNAIDSFLACRRLAIVGVSRDPKDFSRSVFRAFVERGYDVVPVNANGGDIEGRPAVRRIADVEPPIEAALLMIPTAGERGRGARVRRGGRASACGCYRGGG